MGHTWQAGSHLKVWNVFAGAAALENSGSAESAAHGHQDMPHVARFTPTCSCTRTRTPAHGHPCTSVRVGDEDWRRRPHEQAHTARPRPGPTKPDARPREPRTRRSPPRAQNATLAESRGAVAGSPDREWPRHPEQGSPQRQNRRRHLQRAPEDPWARKRLPAGRSLGTWEDAKACHPRVESHQPERMAGESARQERRSRQKGMMERRGDRGVGRPATSRETERTLTETTK